MIRYNYNKNHTWQNQLLLGRLNPVFLNEVVPGQSNKMTYKASFMSRPTTIPLMNRLWLDAFTFYVPYRLCWNQWPQFIAAVGPDRGGPSGLSGSNTTSSGVVNSTVAAPGVTAKPNVLPRIAPTSGGDAANVPALLKAMGLRRHLQAGGGTGVNALPLYAYWEVWNEYFRLPYEAIIRPSGGYNPASPGTEFTHAPVRQSRGDFHRTALVAEAPTASVAIGSTVDSVRSAFAQDRFMRLREMYGDKYVDYLRALGVEEVSAAIIDKPELLGKASIKAEYKIIDATAGYAADPDPEIDPAALGPLGGYYFANLAFEIPTRFFQEHGIVMTFVVPRLEAPNASDSHPVWNKAYYNDFWSPEFDKEQVQSYPMALFNEDLTGTAFSQTVVTEKYLDYKAGYNLNATMVGNSGSPPTTPGAYVVQQEGYTGTLGLATVRDRHLVGTSSGLFQDFLVADSFVPFSFQDAVLSGVSHVTEQVRSPVSKSPKAL